MSGVFRVMGINGDTHLGGDDFDNRIVTHLIEEFKAANGVDLSKDPIAMQRLKEVAEEAKIELSEVRETHILCEAISMSDKGPLTLETTLTRDKFEDFIREMVDGTRRLIDLAIQGRGADGGPNRYGSSGGRLDPHPVRATNRQGPPAGHPSTRHFAGGGGGDGGGGADGGSRPAGRRHRQFPGHALQPREAGDCSHDPLLARRGARERSNGSGH